MRKFGFIALVAVLMCATVFAACDPNADVPAGKSRVIFESNGGSAVDAITVDTGTEIEKPIDPTFSGKRFVGWYSDAGLKRMVDFPFVLTKNMTLYAKWGEPLPGLSTFEAVSFPSVTIPYDGDKHIITVAHAPAGTKITYTNNEATEPGVYDATAVLTKSGFTSRTIAAKLTIEFIATEGLAYTPINGDAEYRVTRGSANMNGAIYIPTEVDGIPVTEIADDAFRTRRNITSVALPAGLKKIGNYAFADCYNLTKVVIPATVTHIGQFAFSRILSNYNLLTVVMKGALPPTQVSSFSGVRAIIVPAAAMLTYRTAWGGTWFYQDTDVVEGKFILNKEALKMYIGNERDVAIPQEVTKLDEKAFGYCPLINTISLHSGVTQLGTDVFVGCFAATVFVESENPPVLDSGSFTDINAVKAFIVSEADLVTYTSQWPTVTSKIYSSANVVDNKFVIDGSGKIISYFGTDRNLVLPASVTGIGSRAFHGASLISLTVSVNVTEIAENAFDYRNAAHISNQDSSTVTLVTNNRLTIYAEASAKPLGWNASWNSQGRSVFWGCILPEEKDYVLFFTKELVSNINNREGSSAPYRAGHTFGGWTTVPNGTTAEYTMEDIQSWETFNVIPATTVLYTVWIPM